MYSTDLRDQFFSEAIPLKPLVCRAGSAQSVTLAVPPAPAIAGLQISTVAVSLTLPSGSVVSADAVAISGTPLWTATFPAGAFSTSGKVAEGFTVALGGNDERGEARVWIVATGDLEVKSGDATPTPGESYYLVKLRDSEPDDPVEGDAYVSDELHIFAGGEWVVIGGGHDAAKLDGAAAYPAWDSSSAPIEGMILSHNGKLWQCLSSTMDEPSETSEDWRLVTIDSLKQDALSSAQLAAVNSGATSEKVATWDGYAAQIAAKANATDLPYAMVTISTPTVWLFSGSGVQSGHVYSIVVVENEGFWTYSLKDNGSQISYFEAGEQLATLDFSDSGTPPIDITATLAGYALLDRANNLVDATTGNVTLTLPAYQEGKVRDLLVACTIGLDGNDEPWSVIFQGQGSEAPSGAAEISFKAEGDDAASATFPVPAAAGDWWYSLTERAPHVFAVSLKQLQDVSQPVTQGGS